jgi:signal transduction histidine kinase
MQLLPLLVTSVGKFALPLSSRCARRLITSVLLADSCGCDEQVLGDALADDPALVLWAVCRASASCPGEIHSLRELSAWLAHTGLDELGVRHDRNDAAVWEHETEARAPTAEMIRVWADLAARSTAAAHLAAGIASFWKLDADRAYFLGLLHLAPGWLDSSSLVERSLEGFDALPQWLRQALTAIDSADIENVTSAAGCLAAAVKMSRPKSRAGRLWPGFKFDRQAHTARIAAARKDWQLAAATPEEMAGELPALLRKLDRLRKLDQEFRRTLEAEKLDALKELAYGAGHEINNPLANISARAQTLLQLERDPDRRRMLAAINTQAFRAHEMIADMMLFARPPQPRLESVELAQLVREVVVELTEQASAQHTELVFEAPARPFVIRADQTQIAVALRAVCVNALEALGQGGRVEIELREAVPVSKGAQITISDNGPGFPDEVRRHIFDPFYSGREAGRGLGFGLTKCWRIVTMHGGQIDVESSPGNGARFAITLPMPLDR